MYERIMKAVPDFPSDIDRSITKEQAEQIFKDFIENRHKIIKKMMECVLKEIDKDK